MNMRRVIEQKTEQNRLLRAFHEGLGETKQAQAMGGHFGRTKTLSKLTSHYYWRGMKTDVESLVNINKSLLVN